MSWMDAHDYFMIDVTSRERVDDLVAAATSLPEPSRPDAEPVAEEQSCPMQARLRVRYGDPQRACHVDG